MKVVTPFQRKENLDLLINVIKGKAGWIVLIDNPELKSIFPDWVDVRLFNAPEKRPGLCISNVLFNEFIAGGLEPEEQYMILCDDDSVEEGFFNKIPNADVVVTSMKRGQRIPSNGCGYGLGDLIASPDNMACGKVGGEQVIIKGKILKDFRYGLSPLGDWEMIEKVIKEYTPVYVPEANVLFNYFEDYRYDSFRRMPRVMFIGDLYCAAQPNMGKSEWEGNIWASLESTGLVDVGRFHMDNYFYHTGERGDAFILEQMEHIKPDYTVIVLYKPLGSDASVLSKDTIEKLSRTTKVISIWGDLEAVEQRAFAREVAPFCWKVIGTASKEVVESEGYTYMHVPKDPKIFNNPNKERDIEVVFSGSYGYGREERRQVLQYVIDKGVKLVVGGSEGGDHFTTEEYADRYKRAKMAISFSVARGLNVVNARPFEVMSCGALLLEQESPELAKLYTPFVDYVPWKDEVDLYEKICYYTGNKEEREKIALSGQEKTHKLYSAHSFWKTILER